jgi:hypothetical protein
MEGVPQGMMKNIVNSLGKEEGDSAAAGSTAVHTVEKQNGL